MMRYCPDHQRIYIHALGRWCPFEQSVLHTMIIEQSAHCDLCRDQRHSDALQLTAFGETKSLGLWASDSRCPVSYKGLWHRIRNKHLPHEMAITLRKYPLKYERLNP